jgi:hypothetical protein
MHGPATHCCATMLNGHICRRGSVLNKVVMIPVLNIYQPQFPIRESIGHWQRFARLTALWERGDAVSAQ